MTQDQSALQEASGLMERIGRKPMKSSKLVRKMNHIANRSGLSERTRNVIRYAIEKYEEGSAGLAWRILLEEQARQRSGESSDFTPKGEE